MSTEATLRLDTTLQMFEMRSMKARFYTLCWCTPLTVHIDTLGRLSVYTVPSTSTSYTALLPHFLPPRTSLPHTLVMIVLDWTRPWTFVDELQTWLEWVETWAKGDGSRDLEIVREENRERCGFRIYKAIVGVIIIYIQCSHTSNNTRSHQPIHCLPIQHILAHFYL